MARLPRLAAIGLSLVVSAATAQDAVRGAALYESRCGGCHALDSNRVGPRHAGVVGRRAGSLPDFAYSPALARSTLVWNGDTLRRWLTDPEALIPGQRMNFRVADPTDRADIVAFLEQATPAPPGSPASTPQTPSPAPAAAARGDRPR